MRATRTRSTKPFARLRWWHVYLVLLALSHLVQWVSCREPVPAAGQQVVEVPRQGADGPVDGDPVRIAYRDRGEGAPVVYLHGSPGSGSDSLRLVEHLASGYRVISPDLPGFGASTRWLPDYGIDAHAWYVTALMDRLGIERAHFIAHSMGSGVAFHIADRAPERVASITSYAGIGIQEGEGSGDYHFEHFKYALGYAGLVVLPEALPHFGWMGPRWLRHSFIRNFWDTDQRPLRGILDELEVPFLIVQGRDDPLVPARTAEEHHRIVEHSELVMLDSSHFMVFTRAGSERLAGEILPFLARHDDPGRAPTRRTVDRSGGPRPTIPLPTDLRIEEGLGPWTEIGILVAATFVSEDLTCISAGLLARDQRLDLFVAIFGCLAGIFITDLGLWLVGRVLGRRALSWRWVARRVSPATLDRFGTSFDRHLGKAVVASRFVPGTRVPMYIAAGIVSRRPFAFALWLFVAAAIWTPILVILSMAFGPTVARPLQSVLGAGWLAWIVAVVLLLVIFRTIAMLFSWRGRARLVALVSRIWRWEFWPMWLFYLPIVPWVAFLAIRHRGITTLTVANPALPHGGFVGESKIEILDELPTEWLVPSYAVPVGDDATRLEGLRTHAATNGWELPLILKPDEGQRGAGLKMARTWDDVRDYLARDPRAVLAQTYHPGPFEAGIFYYRLPGQEAGRIFSITDKKFPEVVGDGRSTLEELILRHPRLRMQAGTFTRRHEDQLDRVLERDERMRLAVAGNHAQGTMFCDGGHLVTPELERTVDAIARDFDGFFFGRFDVRYRDVDEFMAGRDLAIVELNGVTSESTNIYDPAWSLLRAYRTLAEQWSLAFRIGAVNRTNGHAPSSIVELFRAAVAHYGGRPEEISAD